MLGNKLKFLAGISIIFLVIFLATLLYNRSITGQFKFLDDVKFPNYMEKSYFQDSTQIFPLNIFSIDVQNNTYNNVTLKYEGRSLDQAENDVSNMLKSQGFVLTKTNSDIEYTDAQSSHAGVANTVGQIPYTVLNYHFALPHHVSHCVDLYVTTQSDDSSSITVGCTQPR